MMYGKMKPEPKKSGGKMPAALLAVFKKEKPMPSRGGRTATNKMNKKK